MSADAQTYCGRLKEIRIIPYDPSDKDVDPVYSGLYESGENAIPCLVELITDTTVIKDPREGDPHIHGFTVGDAAVVILLDITNQDPRNMLPPDVRKNWDKQGMFAYFKFVQTPGKRNQIKTWWQDWRDEKLKNNATPEPPVKQST